MAFMNARDQAHLRTYGQRDYRQWYNATTARIGWARENVLFYGKGEFAVSTIESTILDSRGLGPGTRFDSEDQGNYRVVIFRGKDERNFSTIL
jgi:hypothetical protein